MSEPVDEKTTQSEAEKRTSTTQPEGGKRTSITQPEGGKRTSITQPEGGKRTSITEPESAKRTSISREPGKKSSHQDTRRHSRGSAEFRDLSRLNVRKTSFGFGGVPGIRPIERSSLTGVEFKRPIAVYLPTYQLDPLKKFHLANVLKAVEEILDETWHDHKYHEMDSPALAIKLAGECMRKVKDMGFDRYRIISIVTIGQKRKQSYNNTISMLWDIERDGYVDTRRETTTAFVQVTLFGIYLD